MYLQGKTREEWMEETAYESEEKYETTKCACHCPDFVQSAEIGGHDREPERGSGGGQAHPGEDAGVEGTGGAKGCGRLMRMNLKPF